MMMMECQAAIYLPLLQPNHSIHTFNHSMGHTLRQRQAQVQAERFKNIAMQAKLVASDLLVRLF